MVVSSLKAAAAGHLIAIRPYGAYADLCFFCQIPTDKKLFSIRADNAGQALQDAVSRSDNPEFKVRLAKCISNGDAHAIDAKYDRDCWRKHVFYVLRKDIKKKAGRVWVRPCKWQVLLNLSTLLIYKQKVVHTSLLLILKIVTLI